MITDLLLTFFGSLVDVLFTLLAPFTWGAAEITSVIAPFVSEIRQYNHFAPVSEFMILASVHLSIFTSVTVFKWFIWVIRRIADVIP